MLARAGEIPRGGGWTFEPKMDGFRCLVCTHSGFHACSRRGWDVTPLLPELAASLPAGLQLDGELVGLNDSGRPDFHRLSSRILHKRTGADVTLFVFDVLAVEGLPTTMLPYPQRRELLEELVVENGCVGPIASFEDGDALFRAVCEQGLEGIVAKRGRDPCLPDQRGWVKTKNRVAPRFAEESEGMGCRRRSSPRAVLPGDAE